eukprot:gene8212-37_t
MGQSLWTSQTTCEHDGKCYRKNPEHFEQYLHPLQYPDGFPVSDEEEEPSSKKRKIGLNEELPSCKSPFRVNYNYGSSDFPPIPSIQILQTRFTQEVLGKPGWEKKLKDKKIMKKWIDEGKEIFSQEMMDYTFAKLENSIKLSEENGILLLHRYLLFIYNVSKLENIPEEKKDWHPGSKNQVFDLVHPSLYPFVNGKTKISDSKIIQTEIPMFRWICDGEVKKLDLKKSNFSSDTYQWLPADIEVTIDGKVNFLSYINNLHPYEHRALYKDISKILEKFICLFEHVIPESALNPPELVEPDNIANNLTFNAEYDPHSEVVPIDLRGTNLQVIVKLANIVLTEKNPKYEGGVWHVEGMENEDIVASGIYYYDNSNISESELHFRQSVHEPEYEQNDFEYVEKVFGLKNEHPLIQEIGYVKSHKGRCIAFPNIYQHRVAPFQLLPKKKKGHRKILVFFLVNPKNKILSTSMVPPQQNNWLEKYLVQYQCFGNFPNDVISLICEFLEYPISLNETRKDRDKLMEERKYIQGIVDENHYLREFSLCEH